VPGTLDVLGPVYLPDPVDRSHPLNRGRVAWWLALPGLDGGRQWFDLVGQSHGTLTNGPTWGGTTRPGGWGGLQLDGVDDCVDAGKPAAIVAANTLTVAAWVRPAGTGRGDWVTQWGDTPDRKFDLLQGVTAGAFQFFVGDPSSNLFNSGPSTTAIVAGTWYHVVGVSDGATVRLYVNGRLESSAAGPATLLATSTANVRVGACGTGALLAAAGGVDDVGIWSRPLSAAEVWTLHDSSRRGYPGPLNRLAPSLLALVASGGSGATASPATATASWVANGPSVSAGATAAPATVTAAWTSNAPTVSAGATVTPGTATAAWTPNSPSVSAGATATATAATAAWTAGAPSVAAGATASPSPASASWVANSPSFGSILVIPTTDPGYSRSIDWATQASGGYLGGPFDYSPTAGQTATFAATLPQPGTYKVAITFVEGANRAPDTGVAVGDGATTVLTTTVDQTTTPSDFSYNGSGFRYLGTSLAFSTTSASVVLTAPGPLYSIADAVYFEPVSGGIATPAAAAATWVVNTPVVSAGATVAPASVGLTWFPAVPSVSAGAVAAPAAAHAGWAVNPVEVIAGIVRSPDPSRGTLTSGAPDPYRGTLSSAQPDPYRGTARDA
jgi:hypothetical protein